MIYTTIHVDVDFSEPAQETGLYNLAEAAIDKEEPIVLFGCRYKGKSLGPLYAIPVKDSETGVITLSSLTATIGADDMLTPNGYEP